MGSLSQSHPRTVAALGVAALLLAALVLQLTGANPASSQVLTLVAQEASEDPGIDPAADVWSKARRIDVPLTGQLGIYSAGGGSTASVSARALHYKDALYLRLEWSDATQDGAAIRVEDFTDAVALEFPAKSAASVPSYCMGQPGSGVNIWQWRADSESDAHDPNLVYTNSLVDTYPSKDDLWYTARAAGNPVALLGASPVQTLVAETFGTLSPAPAQEVEGAGAYVDGKWAVVFKRPFAASDPSQAEFSVGTETDLAMAVWNGSEGERNGQKSVSTFVKLQIDAGSAVAGSGDDANTLVAIVLAATVVLGAIFLAFGWYGYRQATSGRMA